MEDQPFQSSVTHEDNCTVMYVLGELDYASAPLAWPVLVKVIDEGKEDLVVDMRNSRLLDSEGVKVLLKAHSRLDERGGSMRMRRCNHAVAKVITLLRLDEYLGMTAET